VLALGGAGGVRIPTSVFDVLTKYVADGFSIEEAIAAPRLHCTGTLEVEIEPGCPKADAEYLRKIGYKVQTGISARVSAVTFDSASGEFRAAMR